VNYGGFIINEFISTLENSIMHVLLTCDLIVVHCILKETHGDVRRVLLKADDGTLSNHRDDDIPIED
jgi:hypothetical protein